MAAGLSPSRLPKLPWAVDERGAQRPRLGHPHHRVVDGRVAVGVVPAHRVAHDRRRLPVARVGRQPKPRVHRVQDAPLDRLEPVADVGERPARDDREGVGEVPLLRGLVERDRVDDGHFAGCPGEVWKVQVQGDTVRHRATAYSAHPARRHGPCAPHRLPPTPAPRPCASSSACSPSPACQFAPRRPAPPGRAGGRGSRSRCRPRPGLRFPEPETSPLDTLARGPRGEPVAADSFRALVAAVDTASHADVPRPWAGWASSADGEVQARDGRALAGALPHARRARAPVVRPPHRDGLRPRHGRPGRGLQRRRRRHAVSRSVDAYGAVEDDGRRPSCVTRSRSRTAPWRRRLPGGGGSSRGLSPSRWAGRPPRWRWSRDRRRPTSGPPSPFRTERVVVLDDGDRRQPVTSIALGGYPALLWAGDLDGDGRLDLLLDEAAREFVSLRTLYLSSLAAPRRPRRAGGAAPHDRLLRAPPRGMAGPPDRRRTATPARGPWRRPRPGHARQEGGAGRASLGSPFPPHPVRSPCSTTTVSSSTRSRSTTPTRSSPAPSSRRSAASRARCACASSTLFQAWAQPPSQSKYRDMLLDTGTEEIGHIEMLCTAVALNLEGAPTSLQDEGRRGPRRPRDDGRDARAPVSLGGPRRDAHRQPRRRVHGPAHVVASGNLAADMTANVMAESTGRDARGPASTR